MLNPVTSVQIQTSTHQSTMNHNDFAHPNQPEGEQFNDILTREAAEKDRISTIRNTASTADEANAETTDEIETNDTAHTNNNTVGTSYNIVQNPTLETEQHRRDQIVQITFAENNSSIELSSPFGLSVISTLSQNQPGIHAKQPEISRSLSSAISLPSSQPGILQNFPGNNSLWQSHQAAESADDGKMLPFSIEIDQKMPIRLSESNALSQIDADTIYQPGLSGIAQTPSQSTTQTTALYHIALDTQIGQPQWGDELAQKIVWLANQQHQVAELRLNPVHLGPVEIMLSLTGDNGSQASAQFVSPHLAVREAIEAALPRLREMMAENGIQLGNVMVGAESFQRQEQGERHAHHSIGNAQIFDTNDDSDTNPEKHIISGRHTGIVNTFA